MATGGVFTPFASLGGFFGRQAGTTTAAAATAVRIPTRFAVFDYPPPRPSTNKNRCEHMPSGQQGVMGPGKGLSAIRSGQNSLGGFSQLVRSMYNLPIILDTETSVTVSPTNTLSIPGALYEFIVIE